MSSQISLIDMPELVMDKILEYSDIRSIFTLRKVSSNLRNFINDSKPDIHLTEIEITVNKDANYVWLSYGKGWKAVEYQHIDGMLFKFGCFVISGKTKKILENKDYLSVFRKDMELILRHQKSSLKRFSVRRMKEKSEDEAMETYQKVLNLLLGILKSRSHLLQVNVFKMVDSNMAEAIPFLECFDSKMLETTVVSKPDTWFQSFRSESNSGIIQE